MIYGIIRKVSIGPDYKNAMHFQVGQTVIKGEAEISNIILDPTTGNINIYISSKDEIHLWKSLNSTIPVTVEYDINIE